MCLRTTEPTMYVMQPQYVWYQDDCSAGSIAFRTFMVAIGVLAILAAAATRKPEFLIIAIMAFCAAISPRVLFETSWGALAYSPAPAPAHTSTTVYVTQSSPPPSASATYSYRAADGFGTSYNAPSLQTAHSVTHSPVIEGQRARLGERAMTPPADPATKRAILGGRSTSPDLFSPSLYYSPAPPPRSLHQPPATLASTVQRASLGTRDVTPSVDPATRRAPLGERSSGPDLFSPGFGSLPPAATATATVTGQRAALGSRTTTLPDDPTTRRAQLGSRS